MANGEACFMLAFKRTGIMGWGGCGQIGSKQTFVMMVMLLTSPSVPLLFRLSILHFTKQKLNPSGIKNVAHTGIGLRFFQSAKKLALKPFPNDF